jgi:opacity protein-like surface antigen
MKKFVAIVALSCALIAQASAQEVDQAKLESTVSYLKSRASSGKLDHQRFADEVARVELYQKFCGPVTDEYRLLAKAARIAWPETVSSSYDHFAYGFQVLGVKRSCGLIAEANPQSLAH